MCAPGSRPECTGVESTFFRFVPFGSERRAAHVDDAIVDPPKIVHVNLQAAARVGEKVGDEHIASPRELVEDVSPIWLLERQSDAALATVWMLHDRMEASFGPTSRAHREAALRVAHYGVLYLDDIGAPVGEYRAGRRRIRELRDLEHAYASHR